MADNLARKPDNEDEQNYGWQPDVFEGGDEGDGKPRGNLQSVDSPEPVDPEQQFGADDSIANRNSSGNLHSVGDMEKLATFGKKKSTSTNNSLYKGTEDDATPSGAPGRLLQGVARIAKKHPKKLIGGGGIAGILVSLFLGFSVLQGPLQFVHAAQLLQDFFLDSNEEFGDDRAGKLFRFPRRGGNERRNLGVVGNKVADFYEGRLARDGISPVYEGGTRSTRIVAFEFDLDHPGARANIAELERLGYSVDGNRIDLGSTSARTRRSVINQVFRQSNVGGMSGAVGTRSLKARGLVDFSPLRNMRLAAGESYANFRQSVEDDYRRRTYGGATTNSPQFRGGEVEGEPSEDLTNRASDANADVDSIQSGGTPQVRRVLSGSIDAADVATFGCTLKSLSHAYSAVKYAQIILPMMRIGMGLVTTGNQVMSGRGLSMDELGVHNRRFYNNENNTSWVNARSVQYESGQRLTGTDLPGGQKASLNKPSYLKRFDNFAPGYCNVATSIFGEIVITGASLALGGGVIVEAIGFVAGTAFSEDISTWLASLVGVGQPVSADASGSYFGNQAAYGTRLGSSDAFPGGRMLSTDEEDEVRAMLRDVNQTEFQQQSLVARMFNLESPYSVSSKLAMGLDYNYSLPNITTKGVTGFARLFTSPVTTLTGNVYAQEDEEFDYGFPRFGFTIEEMNNENYENPYENEEQLDSILERRRNTEQQCLNDVVDDLIGTEGIETRQDAINYINDPSRKDESIGNQDGPHQNEKSPDNIPNQCEINPSDYEEFNIEWGIPCYGTEIMPDTAGVEHHLAASHTDDEAPTFFGKSIGTRAYDDEDYSAREKILWGNGGHDNSIINGNIKGCDGGTDGPNSPWGSGSSGNYTSTRGDGRIDDLIRYRFLIADIETANSVACLGGDTESCREIGMEAPLTSNGSNGSSGQIIGDPESSSVDVACDSRTDDLGVHDAYIDGAKVPMRLCGIPNLPSTSSESIRGNAYYIEGANGHAIVSSRVSGAVYQMVLDAQADNVTLSASSSFRTMAHQEALCNSDDKCPYGVYTDVARPGTSKHQNGIAIDFSGMGGTPTGSSSSCSGRMTWNSDGWRWLARNAENYGFQQYSREAWHWDALDSSNRCDSTELPPGYSL